MADRTIMEYDLSHKNESNADLKQLSVAIRSESLIELLNEAFRVPDPAAGLTVTYVLVMR
jgi:hypothetical protein